MRKGLALMNANVPAAGRLVVLTLGAVLCVGARPGSARAQAGGGSLAQTLRRADELYRADKLPQAAELYRQGLAAAAGADRHRCFDRLLAIYVRVGRQDQAIQTGTQYDAWLRRTGETVRARELALDLGRWHLALGHYADAEPHLRRALADLKGAALPPARRVTALTYLALAAEKQRDPRAGQAWREVETFARVQLDDPSRDLDLS